MAIVAVELTQLLVAVIVTDHVDTAVTTQAASTVAIKSLLHDQEVAAVKVKPDQN